MDGLNEKLDTEDWIRWKWDNIGDGSSDLPITQLDKKSGKQIIKSG